MRAAWARIDLSVLVHNYREIKKCIAGGARICAVVKADAYGHGAVQVARVAVREGADYLAVATVAEGMELRAAGFTQAILVLGLIDESEVADVIAHDLTQTISSFRLAAFLGVEAERQGKCAKVHLKVDTGMGRIGVPVSEIADFGEAVAQLHAVEIEGMFSHFAAADSKDTRYTKEQLARFIEAKRLLKERGIVPPICHIAESAAILYFPEAHFDMVRVGVIQYGMMPSEEVERRADLKPVMRLEAKVLFVKEIAAGETIGYGRDYRAERRTRIATLPIGYADGYIRAYAGGAVEIRGRRAKICGRICMDQCMVDVTDIPDVHVGTVATLFGSPTLTVDDAARQLHTINYEITCLVSPRVPRVYVEEDLDGRAEPR